MPFFLRFRYWLEIISVPVFAFLVVHLAGHGMSTLLESANTEHAEEVFHLSDLWSMEVLIGVLLGALFVWLWHRPLLKKWVPCNHDHCHHHIGWPHLLAILALCLHFFPEAGVRYAFLQKTQESQLIEWAGMIGFGAHFLVDVIVAGLISSYWKTPLIRWISFLFIAAIWTLALQTSESFVGTIPTSVEPFFFVGSAFLLAMFVHRPHKPLQECHHCH